MSKVFDLFNLFAPNPCEPFEIVPGSESTVDLIRTIPFDRGDNLSLANVWYNYLSSSHNCIGNPFFPIVKDVLQRYADLDDGQFPPDYLKSTRLYSVLDIIKPTHVLELGSGSSSAIISSFSRNCPYDCLPITIESSHEWLDTTKRKISDIDIFSGHLFYSSTSSNEILEFLSSLLSSDSRLFVYLDSKIINLIIPDFSKPRILKTKF